MNRGHLTHCGCCERRGRGCRRSHYAELDHKAWKETVEDAVKRSEKSQTRTRLSTCHALIISDSQTLRLSDSLLRILGVGSRVQEREQTAMEQPRVSPGVAVLAVLAESFRLLHECASLFRHHVRLLRNPATTSIATIHRIYLRYH